MGLTSIMLVLFVSFTFLSVYLVASAGAIKVTGATHGLAAGTRVRPSRPGIDDLSASGPAFDLYIQALTDFQNADTSEPLSYYQIAGIHGYPQQPWDGVSGSYNSPGFCPHASVLFLPWHRPYLALFEQVLVEYAQDIAAKYHEDVLEIYLTAAETLRIPYWDWAMNGTLPDVVTLQELDINTPDGRVMWPNPLYQYVFPFGIPQQTFPAVGSSSWAASSNTTLRCSSDFETSNQTMASASMVATASTRLSNVYQLFTDGDYFSFSTVLDKTSTGNNAEAIHGAVHNCIGGTGSAYGHMTVQTFSAFDPIFWLHHANLDRLFAMWQILHPLSYVQPTQNHIGTYFIAPGSIDTPESPLAPFHSDEVNAFWTAETVQDTNAFGYTYPELIDWNYTSDQVSEYIREEINKLYNPVPLSEANTTSTGNFSTSRTQLAISKHFHALGPEVGDMEWALKVSSTSTTSDPCSLIVYAFVGEPPHEINDWITASNLAGTYVQPQVANFDHQTIQRSGQISLTQTLASLETSYVLHNLRPDGVLPFLEQNLRIYARDSTGEGIEISSGLKVILFSRTAKPRDGEADFPTYGPIKAWRELSVLHDRNTTWKSSSAKRLNPYA